MKKTRIILCFILIASMILSAASFIGADTASYEIRSGAAVFNSSSNISYFSGSNQLSVSYSPQKNAAEITVSDYGTSAADPYVHLNFEKLGANLSADTYKYVVVTYSVPSEVSSKAAETEIFYAAGETTGATGGKSVSYALKRDGVYHSQIVDLSALWSGKIHLLRLDLFKDAMPGDRIYIDSVVLAKDSAEANAVASYRENKANGVLDVSTKTFAFTNENYSTYLKAESGEAIRGDINLDGKLNSTDSALLKQYLACWDVDIDPAAADINGDGIVTLRDSLMLKLIIAGLVQNPDEATGGIASVGFNNKAMLTALCQTPYVMVDFTSESEPLAAGLYNYIVIVYKTDVSGTGASINGICDGEEASESHSFSISSDNTYHSAIIDMSADPAWSGNISGFKFKFFETARSGQKMYVDSVILAETYAGATAVSNYRVASANGYTLTTEYKLDISANTLGQINARGTYQNVGPTVGGKLLPFTTSWAAAGYAESADRDTLLVMASYNNYIKIADCVDLSKYSAVTVTYGTDKSFADYTSEFGFFSAPTVYGQKADNTKNTANLCFSVPLSTPTPSGAASWVNTRSVTKNINSDYEGPLYLSFYMAGGNGAVITDITFTLKNAEFETSSDGVNSSKGDVVYTVSPDGSTINANGVTYPNSVEYTSGITSATDDVSRVLPTDRTDARTGYDFEEKNVGMFYFLWLGSHGTTGPHDIQKIVEQYGVGKVKGDASVWGPYNYHHFFAEPLYGYYYSSDEWVIRKHIEELTNADVDFIFFDVTNGVPYINVAKTVIKVIHEFNEMGYDAPKIVFYGNDSNGAYTGGKSMMKYLYDNIYAANYYPDTWFLYEGKPVIIGKQSEYNALPANVRSFFTFRQSQWPTEDKKSDAWSWMDFTTPAVPNINSQTRKNEVINVSIAQHMGTIAFGDSGIYGLNVTAGSFITSKLNHGRNWHNGANDTSPGAYKYGYNFQEEWDTVLNKYPDIPIVLVTGWNEWAAGRIQTAGTFREPAQKNMAWFVDTATVDFSRDIEMTRGYYFDNYYMQLISNIRKYKGAAPTLVQNKKKTIDIDGSFDQWNDITVSYRDATGDTVNRNTTAFGNTSYVNNTGRNDISSSKVVYDSEYLYFYVDCAKSISSYNTQTSWMQLYIDADSSSSTGWYGYDYIINYAPESSGRTSIARCTENGKYSFEITDRDISYSVRGNMMMLRVPLSALGIADSSNINFSFKWADSTSKITTMEQMYTDGDTMPHGRLNYVFTNVK